MFNNFERLVYRSNQNKYKFEGCNNYHYCSLTSNRGVDFIQIFSKPNYSLFDINGHMIDPYCKGKVELKLNLDSIPETQKLKLLTDKKSDWESELLVKLDQEYSVNVNYDGWDGQQCSLKERYQIKSDSNSLDYQKIYYSDKVESQVEGELVSSKEDGKFQLYFFLSKSQVKNNILVWLHFEKEGFTIPYPLLIIPSQYEEFQVDDETITHIDIGYQSISPIKEMGCPDDILKISNNNVQSSILIEYIKLGKKQLKGNNN